LSDTLYTLQQHGALLSQPRVHIINFISRQKQSWTADFAPGAQLINRLLQQGVGVNIANAKHQTIDGA